MLELRDDVTEFLWRFSGNEALIDGCEFGFIFVLGIVALPQLHRGVVRINPALSGGMLLQPGINISGLIGP